MADLSARVRGLVAPAIALLLAIPMVGQAQAEIAAPDAAARSSFAIGTADSVSTGVETCEPEIAGGDIAAIEQPPLTHIEEVQQFEEQLSAFEVEREDAVALFNRLRDATRMRLWQFAIALDNAGDVSDPAMIDPAAIERAHPGFPVSMYQLPESVVTLEDLYNDTEDLFRARNKALQLLPAEAHADAVGAELYGIQELNSELDLIVVEFRYQLLRLPRAVKQIQRMLRKAPLPLIQVVFLFWVAIVLFRWWRRWIPTMLQRMRSRFLAIRPRTETIVNRLRTMWYFEQVRKPIEWLLLIGFLFSLLEFDGWDLLLEIVWIIVQWVLLAWFAVAVLNAIAARGAGGLAGESAKLRLQSMRLIATWLVLLGLGLELSIFLVGDAALTMWIWRGFTLLAFPLVLRLLSIWHDELYQRWQRSGDDDLSFDEYAAQRGVSRWVGSAKVAGYLLVSALNSSLMRRIEHLDPSRAAAGHGSDDESAELDERSGLSQEQLLELYQGYDEFGKYGRAERRELVARINDGDSGIVGVVGERGIGRNGFMRQVAEAHDHNTVFLSGRLGSCAALETGFAEQLGLTAEQFADDATFNEAMEKQDVRLVVITDMHLLVYPVMGGFHDLTHLNALFDRVLVPCLWTLTVDRYAWQLINRARDTYTTTDTVIRLQPWTDEQIAEFIQTSCKRVGLEPDFSKLRVPRRFMDTAEEDVQERNRAGLYNMIASMSRGNPSIAIRLFGAAVRVNSDGSTEMLTPGGRDDQDFEGLSLEMLLVLRVIAQCELIEIEHIVRNLRMDKSLIHTTLHIAQLRGWVEYVDGSEQGQRSGYRISWSCFRIITRLLGRKNLLAGVGEERVL